jgi:hypothetical protein
VQILFAFLLGIAFQQRFTTIDQAQRVLYLITLTSAAAAAVLLIAPVAAHRVLFRRNRKDEVVAITSRLASAGLACLAVAILSAVVLVVDFVTGVTVALTITITLGVIVAITWLVVPLLLRRRPEE